MTGHNKSIIPYAMGCEEEVGFAVSYDGGKRFVDAHQGDLEGSIPDDAVGSGQFLKNGGRFYVTMHPEICTPEVTTLDDFGEHVRSNEELLVDIAGNFLLSGGRSEHGLQADEAIVRIQRRVVDGHGNRWGMHDNFGVYDQLAALYADDSNAERVFFGQIKSRSIQTGAGHVTSDKLAFSQKIDGLVDIQRYGNKGSVHRFTSDEGFRHEIRCGDINISDWAVRMRPGSMVLSSMISQTPVPDKLLGPPAKKVISQSISANIIELREDGTLAPSPRLIDCIDYQQRLAEYALTELPKFIGPLSDDHRETAEDQYDFCDDMRMVTSGDATIKLLANRADWAAKMYVIQKKVQAANANGAHRTMHDHQAQALDMAYDRIEVGMKDGELQKPEYGWGYMLRDRNAFLDTVPQGYVDQAYNNAPLTTRASIRSKLFKEYEVRIATWDEVQVIPEIPNRNSMNPYIKIELPDVTQIKLTPEQQLALRQAARKQPPS